MSDCVFILSGDFYYDRESRILHGTEGDVEIQGRLANVLELFIDKPGHKVQLRYNDSSVSGSKFQLSKRTFRNYITEINGLGRQIGLGEADIIKYHSMPGSESRWTLQIFGDDNFSSESDFDKSEYRITVTEMQGAGESSLSPENQLSLGWFATSYAVNYKKRLAEELSNYLTSIRRNTASVITEYRSDMAIDVSDWPERPYHINQIVTQVVEGAGSDVFMEQCELQDELKASTFRYTSLVLRDEVGRELLRRSHIPHWSDEDHGVEALPENDWAETLTLVAQSLDDPSRPTMTRLDYSLEKDGFIVEIRSWPHHSAAFEWDGRPGNRAPKRNRQGGFYTADVYVKSPPGRRISIELSFQYDAWSVSDNRFFTELTYAPAITARIVGAEANQSGFEFRLRQFSSQSPFWRRTDGKHYVKDVMLAGNNPHYLSWHYPDQWIMLGEGYVVTVDAFKAYDRS